MNVGEERLDGQRLGKQVEQERRVQVSEVIECLHPCRLHFVDTLSEQIAVVEGVREIRTDCVRHEEGESCWDWGRLALIELVAIVNIAKKILNALRALSRVLEEIGQSQTSEHICNVCCVTRSVERRPTQRPEVVA